MMRATLEYVLAKEPIPANSRTTPMLDAVHDREIEAKRVIERVRAALFRDRGDITTEWPADLFLVVSAAAAALVQAPYPANGPHQWVLGDRALLFQASLNEALVLIQRYEREGEQATRDPDGAVHRCLTQAEMYVQEFRSIACMGIATADLVAQEEAPVAEPPKTPEKPAASSDDPTIPTAAWRARARSVTGLDSVDRRVAVLVAVVCLILALTCAGRLVAFSLVVGAPPADLTEACVEVCRPSGGAPTLQASTRSQDDGWRCLCDLTP